MPPFIEKIRNKFAILLLIFFWEQHLFSAPNPDPASEHVGIKFEKGTLREVFDIYARERNLNLIIDPNIPKDKTIDLFVQDLPLDQLFELVIASNNLGTKKYGDSSILIFPLEKAQTYRGQPEARKFSLAETTLDVAQFKEMLNSQFPDCRFYLDPNNLDSVIVFGSKDSLDRVNGLFSIFKSSLSKVDRIFVPLKNIDPTTAIAALKNVDKATSIFESPGKNGVVIIGTKAGEIEKILKRVDEEPAQSIKVYQLKYQDLSKFTPLVKALDKNAKVLSMGDDDKLIVQAKGQTLQFIDEAVEALDKPKKQVLFDFNLVEVDLETLKKLGVQMAQQGYTFSEIKALVDSKTYPFLVNLLKDTKHARILANPKLKVIENKSAKITIGDRIPLEVAATSQTDSGALLKFNTQLQWVDAGIKFGVSNVRVHDEKKTSLDLKAEISSVVGYTAKGYPLLRTREVESSLIIEDGETVILAGLINREDRVTTTKVPYLSRLPLLGKIFVTNDRRKVNSEILLFITPRIENQSRAERKISPKEPATSDSYLKRNNSILNELRKKIQKKMK